MQRITNSPHAGQAAHNALLNWEIQKPGQYIKWGNRETNVERTPGDSAGADGD